MNFVFVCIPDNTSKILLAIQRLNYALFLLYLYVLYSFSISPLCCHHERLWSQFRITRGLHDINICLFVSIWVSYFSAFNIIIKNRAWENYGHHLKLKYLISQTMAKNGINTWFICFWVLFLLGQSLSERYDLTVSYRR